MQGYDTSTHKTGSIDTETPATIVLTDDTQLHARDYFVTEDGLIAVYVTAKETGIDARIPQYQVRAIVTSDAARAERTEDNSDDIGVLPRLLKIEEHITAGDEVRWEGERWNVTDVDRDANGHAHSVQLERDDLEQPRTIDPVLIERLYPTAHRDRVGTGTVEPVNGNGGEA